MVDTSTCYHVTSLEKHFFSCIVGGYDEVRTGNSGVSNVVGLYKIQFVTSMGCNLLVNEVRHVPDLE